MEEPTIGSQHKSGGDPLGAMYFVAAVLMGVAAIAIVVLLFLPRDWLARENPDAYSPESLPAYAAPDGGAPVTITPAEAERREEAHEH